MSEKPIAEREEEREAGITGPRCPFCESRQTQGATMGWPNAPQAEGWWKCGNCDESGAFDAAGLHWIPDGEGAPRETPK